MDYLTKYQENPFTDLYWNLPTETPQGTFLVLGGNANSFLTTVKTAEFITNFTHLEELKTALPDSLKSKLPNLEHLLFLSSTDTGSFKDASEIKTALGSADSALIVGDLSKNSVTAKALASACQSSEKPLFITRDAVDLLLEGDINKLLMHTNITVMGSIVQWQKIFRAVYYPKMLMPSQSLVQIAEAFHKFTLSYPIQIVTFFGDQILVAQNGRVALVPLAKTSYSAFTLWSGELAAKIAIMNLFNPEHFIEASVAAIFR